MISIQPNNSKYSCGCAQARLPSHAVDAESWRLLQNTPPPEQVEKKIGSRRAKAGDFERIRCPKCAWHPRPSDRWLCWNCGEPEFFFGGCGTSWNTFTTKGRCPGCSHQWRWTICLRCHNWSLHEEWYEKKL